MNDLDLKKWKKYSDLITDSLWIIPGRDSSGVHQADYHGNFVPQIPNQLIKRFTKKGDVVLDTFLGSGTTLIESQRLERSGIGFDLSQKILKIARERINKEVKGNKKIFTEVLKGDATKEKTKDEVMEILKKHKKKNVQLVIMHPPYHNIIKFSSNKNDLSNARNIEDFMGLFGKAVDNFIELLENGHYFAVVIGDIYVKKEWIPMGFLAMQEVLRHKDFKLKSILVKNMTNNRAKRNQEKLWRFRALKGGFYIFKHEYIFLFQKKN